MFDENTTKKKRKRRALTSTQKITSNSYQDSLRPLIVKQAQYTYDQLQTGGIYGNITSEIFSAAYFEDPYEQKWKIFQIYYIILGLFYGLQYLLTKSKRKSKTLTAWLDSLLDVKIHLSKICCDILVDFGMIVENDDSSGMIEININQYVLQGILIGILHSELLVLVVDCMTYICHFSANCKKYAKSLLSDAESYILASQFIAHKFDYYEKKYKQKNNNQRRKISSLPSVSSSSSLCVSVNAESGSKRREIGRPPIEDNNGTSGYGDDLIDPTKCQWCPLTFTSTSELNIHGLVHLLPDCGVNDNNTNNKNDC